MDRVFPVTHSILATEALKTEVLANYDLDDVLEVKLLNQGLNDTYVVDNSSGIKYILRVYRHNWRSHSDILYEIDVLNHLHHKGVAVAIPLPQKNGEFIKAISAPEGERYIVLFAYAEGREAPYEKDIKTKLFNYGVGVGKIHQATMDFVPQHSRFALDMDYLLSDPLQSIVAVFSHRQSDCDYLQQLADKIRTCLSQLPLEELERGFCHGDLHTGNANHAENGTVTFYDFDSSGWGYRSYDLSVVRWSGRLQKKEYKYWKPFLKGYLSQRSLSKLDLQAVPLFVGVRHFLLLGIHTANGRDFGYGFMNDRYFDNAIQFFKQWEKQCLK